MDEKPTLFLHLGMSKTATTWFQREVFPLCTGIEFRDQPQAQNILEGGPAQGILARAFRRSPLIWQAEGQSLFRRLLDAPEGKWMSNKSLLVSDQSAGPRLLEYGDYQGSHWEQERMDPMLLGSHLKQMTAEAQKRGFSRVKIILVFRRQDHWLASKYAQRSDRIVGASQSQFEERIDYYLSREKGYYSDGLILNYNTLYEELSRAIGRESLLFLPYELLKTEPADFLGLLSEFMAPGDRNTRELVTRLGLQAAATKANVRSQGASEWELRQPRAEHGVSTIASVLYRRLSKANNRHKSIRLTPGLSEKILNTYRESNARLGQELELDLKNLGYFK